MKRYFFGIIIFMGALWFPSLIRAATSEIAVSSSAPLLHDLVEVAVFIDTEQSFVNAIEGTLMYDREKLFLADVRDGDSIVNFWIEKTEGEGEFRFSGIIPGGYEGRQGKVISLLFETLVPGQASVELSSVSFFMNDGVGTKESVPPQRATLAISTTAREGDIRLHDSDFYSPESFTPSISRSESLFDNEWFLVFETKDKGSGIAGYKVKEARYRPLLFFKQWKHAKSPYVLSDQSKQSFILVKATDKAGNETIETIRPDNQKPLFEEVSVSLFFILLLLGVVWFLHFLYQKTKYSE